MGRLPERVDRQLAAGRLPLAVKGGGPQRQGNLLAGGEPFRGGHFRPESDVPDLDRTGAGPGFPGGVCHIGSDGVGEGRIIGGVHLQVRPGEEGDGEAAIRSGGGKAVGNLLGWGLSPWPPPAEVLQPARITHLPDHAIGHLAPRHRHAVVLLGRALDRHRLLEAHAFLGYVQLHLEFRPLVLLDPDHRHTLPAALSPDRHGSGQPVLRC